MSVIFCFAKEHGRKLASFALAHGDMAKLYLERADLARAVNESRDAVEIFAHVTGRRDVRTGPYLWLVHSEILRRSGDLPAARDWAQRALDASRKYDAPSAPSIRQAEAALRAAQAKP